MLRILTIIIGLVLLALAGAWFASPLLDGAVTTAAGSLVKTGTSKLALDNMASIVLAGLGVIGLVLTAWAALGMGGTARQSAAKAETPAASA